MKNLLLAASLPAPPNRLYSMYLNSKSHSAFTGQPAKIDPRPLGQFRAFDTALSGKILHLVPNRLIIQSWRSSEWPANSIDSTLTLLFLPEKAGKSTRIELSHINIPDSDFAGVSHGWEKYYWTPWREYLRAKK